MKWHQYSIICSIIIGLFIILTGWFYFISPLIKSHHQFVQTERLLIHQLKANQSNKSSIHITRWSVKKPSVKEIGWLTHMAQENRLTIEFLSFFSSQEMTLQNNQITKIVLLGTFKQHIDFLSQIAKENNIVFSKILLQSTKATDSIRLTLDVLFLSEPFKLALPDSLLSTDNPFCVTTSLIWPTSNLITVATLSSIKMIGYLQLNKKKMALIELPDHLLQTVSIGMFLAKEKGYIFNITPDAISVKLPNQQVYFLKK